MATTTRASLRTDLSRELGDYYGGTTTSAGNGGGTTLIDTGLANLPGGGDDDAFAAWYVLITSGDNDGEARRIASYAASSVTVTVEQAFSNQVASGVTYELHRLDPSDYHNVINQALEELFPLLYLPIRDETLVIDDRLSNSQFETYSGGFTGWTEVGSPTVTQETTIKIQGSGSAKVVASGANGQLTQAPAIQIKELTGKTVVFECFVYATAASAGRIRLDWDGSNFESHDYHTGQDQWELQRLTAQVPATATRVKAICEAADGTTVYFDNASLVVGDPIARYAIPASILRLAHVYQQRWRERPYGEYDAFSPGDDPAPGHILRLEGYGLLSRPSSDSATTEIGPPQTRLVVAYGAMLLNRLLASPTRSAASQREGYRVEAERWELQVRRLAADPKIRMRRLGYSNPSGVWRREADSSGDYLVFHRHGATTRLPPRVRT